MNRLLIFLLFACIVSAQTAQLSLSGTGPTSVYPGSTVNLTLSLSNSSGLDIVGLQWNQSLPANAITVMSLGTASSTATKGLFCNPAQTTCLTIGLTGTPPQTSSLVYADGVIATYVVTVSPTAPAGVQTIAIDSALQKLIAANGSGNAAPITTSSTPFTFTVLSFCDLNGDKQTNAADVLIATNQATGQVACTNDMTGDGVCNVLDVQRIVVASKGGACRVGQ